MRYPAALACLFLAWLLPQARLAAQATDERQVLAVVNAVRADPAAFGQGLRAFRGLFHANLYVLPGSDVENETAEGVAAVDEAIAYLGHQGMAPALQPSALLAAAAAAHVAEQARNGATGHEGGDGSSPGDRARRLGGSDEVAEVIAYGATDAVDAVRQLIVDDGVPDRGHRAILFDPRLRTAGVACGPHPQYRTMCVIDLGLAPERERPLRFAGWDAGARGR